MDDLCTIDDVRAELSEGSTVTDDRIVSLIAVASQRIRDYTGQTITQVEDDDVTIKLAPGTEIVILPELPVTAVSDLVLDDTALVEEADYYWTSAGLIYRVWPLGDWQSGWCGVDPWAPPATLALRYTHGFAEVPAPVSWACARLAAEVLGSREPASISSETMPDYSYVLNRTLQSLTEVRAVLDHYKVRVLV